MVSMCIARYSILTLYEKEDVTSCCDVMTHVILVRVTAGVYGHTNFDPPPKTGTKQAGNLNFAEVSPTPLSYLYAIGLLTHLADNCSYIVTVQPTLSWLFLQ